MFRVVRVWVTQRPRYTLNAKEADLEKALVSLNVTTQVRSETSLAEVNETFF